MDFAAKIIDSDYNAGLSEIFRPGGILSRALKNYEPRENQTSMAEAVIEAFRSGKNLVVEAGTGTGKTFAYLLPAIMSGMRVVISTGTINLQEQIYFKDIPFLRDKLGLKFEAALMKGRQNYLCRRKFKRFIMQPLFDFAWEGAFFDKIVKWSERTISGDRAEIKGLPEEYSSWSEISSPGHTCMGSKCDYFEDCFVTKMKRDAQSANIIVVNHALFFSDLALREAAPGVEIIPSYDAAILDEAHDVQEIATNHFGISASTAMVAELIRDAMKSPVPKIEAPAVDRALSGINSASKSFFEKLGGQSQGERLSAAKNKKAAQEAEKLIHGLKQLASKFDNYASAGETECKAISERANELAASIEFIFKCEDPEYVYYREAKKGWSSIKAAPIEVGPIFQDKLYPNVPTVIYTSATISVAGDFKHFNQSVGLEGASSLSVGTSFDPGKQSLLYIPRDLPDPADANFADAISPRIRELVEAVGSRAFLLFTSYKTMNEVWERLEGELPGLIMKQGDAPKTELLERFRKEPSVLFATMSFWQGVDIPGSALSLVVIDKIPFASPSDPVVEARIEMYKSRGGNPFGEYQLPRAVLLLRQGLGRLLRHRNDKGILAMLDKRFHTKSYGKTIKDSLKDHKISDNINMVKTFINEEGI